MPKRVDHKIRRRELASAAAELIAERGAHHVKLLDVAKRAGCTTGAIVYFFPNKEALWLEAIRYACELQMEGLKGSKSDLLEMTRLALPITPEQTAVWRMSLSMTEYSLWHNDVTVALRPMYTALEEFFCSACSEAMARGQLPSSTNIEMTMCTLWSWLDGLAVQAIQDSERWPSEKQEAALQHFFSLLGWNEDSQTMEGKKR